MALLLLSTCRMLRVLSILRQEPLSMRCNRTASHTALCAFSFASKRCDVLSCGRWKVIRCVFLRHTAPVLFHRSHANQWRKWNDFSIQNSNSFAPYSNMLTFQIWMTQRTEMPLIYRIKLCLKPMQLHCFIPLPFSAEWAHPGDTFVNFCISFYVVQFKQPRFA